MTRTKQVLTGKRYFSASVGETVFPGTRQLPFEVQVNGAKNGELIQPTFEVWMDGNTESAYKSIDPEPVKVSAAPNYNVQLVRNTQIQWRDDYDFSTGNSGAVNNTAGTISGRMYGYGINIELRNADKDKKFKGIELPEGKITFDLDLTAYISGVDSTGTGAGQIMPMLWDYKGNSGTTTGNEGRLMQFNSNTSTNCEYAISPLNTGTAFNAVVDGGTWKATQTNNVISVEVDAYEFLNSNGDYYWPTHKYFQNTGDVVS